MTNDDKDLKPCKICNKKHNEMQEYGIGPCNSSTWFVRLCLNCGWQPEASKNEEKANEAWNTRSTPQQPSEPLKELDRDELLGSIAQAWCNENNKNKEMDATLAMDICDIIFKKFGQLSEKKALSVSGIENIIEKILKPSCTCNDGNGIVCVGCFYRKDIATAIFDALPARKEVRWPEFPDKGHKSSCHCGYCQKKNIRKEIIDACKKAYEEALPAQREVRYPEYRTGECGCMDYGGCGCKRDDFNQAIDEFKKLNS